MSKQQEEINEILAGLNEKQKEAATRQDGRYLVLASAGSGKALKNGSLVQTPNGPVVIESLKVGDSVFGADGKPSKVTGVYPQGEKEIYEVYFSDGAVIQCSPDHLWNYQTASMRTSTGKWKTATIKEIHENTPLKTKSGNYERYNVYIPMTAPVEYKKKDLPLHPYLLGALLGDGYLRKTGQTFSNPEKDVVEKVEKHLKEIGYTLRLIENSDYSIKNIERKFLFQTKQYFSQSLEDLGLLGTKSETKFIPSEYKRSSIEDRLAILQGLIDTDGTIDGSQYEYSTSSIQLARDVREIAQSLGLTASLSIRENPTYTYNDELKIGKPHYRIRLKMSRDISRLHSSEKHERSWKVGQSYARRTIRDIVPTGKFAEMTCIKVDNADELFLTDDFVVTHNTRVITTRVAYLIKMGVTPWHIVAVSFTKKASNELTERIQSMIGEVAADVHTGTFHSLCMRILLKHQSAMKMQNLTVLDEGESRRIIEELSMNYGYLKEATEEIRQTIDIWGTDGLLPEDLEGRRDFPQDFISIFTDYVGFKRSVGYVDFNDILTLTSKLFELRPDILKEYSEKYRYLIIDEAQDLNNIQMKLAIQLSSHHGNYMLVGDDLQCQPAGTQVLMVDGTEKKIEEIKAGDRVVSYAEGKFSSTTKTSKRSWNAKGQLVLATSSKPVEEVVKIKTETGKESRYAPNHLLYVRFRDNRESWITYIMGNEEGQYRVGKTALFTKGDHSYSGIRTRMHQEKCTHAWILGVYDNKQDAWFAEQIAAVQFGIPQITFQLNKVDYTESFVDKLFESIPNMEERIKKALSFFGRDFNYPFALLGEWRGVVPRRISRANLFTLEACNLLPGYLEVLEYQPNSDKGEYSLITEVELEGPSKVYGITVDRHHNYVADGILTHNCIYGFRGSNVNNIMNIRGMDNDVETILLEQNYRSSGNIVKASNSFIANNNHQMEKISYTANDDGAPLFIYASDDEVREGEYIVNIIEGLMRDPNLNYSYEDIAILYRSNYLSQNVEFALSSAGIPYDIPGGHNFYDREEIKTLVGYLRALDNPLDDLALEYVINRPKRGIGDTTVNRMKMFATGAKVPLSAVLPHVDDVPKINKPTKAKIKEVAAIMEKGREMLKTATEVTPIMRYIMLETKLMTQYDTDKSADVDRIQNIQELWNVASQFDMKEKEPLEEGQTILTQFLTETALYIKPEAEDEMGRVTLSTIHSSKGLEYKAVFVIGLQDGTFPSNRSRDRWEDYEEERRLMYVAMTRAKELLFLSYNKKRYIHGRPENARKSPFLNEIPGEFVKYIGIRK